jgi:hypothetical protein
LLLRWEILYFFVHKLSSDFPPPPVLHKLFWGPALDTASSLKLGWHQLKRLHGNKWNTVLRPGKVVLHHLHQTGDSYTLKNQTLEAILETCWWLTFTGYSYPLDASFIDKSSWQSWNISKSYNYNTSNSFYSCFTSC